MFEKYKQNFVALIILIIVLGVFWGSSVQSASNNLIGYAWSDTIGWIKMFPDGDDSYTISYGVSFNDSTGVFSGYAWSDNIGWIDFTPSSGYPESPSHGVELEVDDTVTGWARALSGADEVDGWDGWIKMSDSGEGYGVSLGEGSFDGYAWGSDVVGWIDFDAVQLEEFCGDGVCDIGENFGTCPTDCGPICGDDNCEENKGEGYEGCPEDCGPVCPDGDCETDKGENFINCPDDCSGINYEEF